MPEIMENTQGYETDSLPDRANLWEHQKASLMASVITETGIASQKLNLSEELIQAHYALEHNPTRGGDAADVAMLHRCLMANADVITMLCDKQLSPYSELYDANPDKFADMPTTEFIDTAQELVALCELKDRLNLRMSPLESELSSLVSAIAAEELHQDPNLGASFADFAKGALSELAADAESRQGIAYWIDEGLSAVYEGSYDKTPREIQIALKEFFESALSMIKSRVSAIEQKQQEILDSQKQG